MNQRKIVYNRVIQLIKIRKQQLDDFKYLMNKNNLPKKYDIKLVKARKELKQYAQSILKIDLISDKEFEKLIRVYAVMLGLVYGIKSKS